MGRFRKVASTRSRRRDPDTRLRRYLTTGQGCAAVVGNDTDDLREAVLRSVGACGGVRTLTISARSNGLDGLAALLRGGRGRMPAVDSERIFDELTAARTEQKPLVIVAHDADLASPASLERLRIAAESFADESTSVRLVLCGGNFLLHLLQLPRMQGLSTRVTLQLRLDG